MSDSPCHTPTDQIEAAIRLLHQPSDVFEIRVLNANGKPGTAGGFYDDPDKAAADAWEYSHMMRGNVFITLNPVSRSLLARSPNKMTDPAGTGKLTKDTDIVSRRWIFIDLDPVKPKEAAGQSSTEAELDKVIEAGACITAWLCEDMNWTAPVRVESGNGLHLYFACDLPTDDDGLHKSILHSVAAWLARERPDLSAAVEVDLRPHNPSRIAALPGCLKRKGASTPERPHRVTRIVSDPAKRDVIPWERLQAVAALAPQPKQPIPPSNGHYAHNGYQDGEDVEKRARAYVATMEPAIKGQNGSGQTYKVAAVLVKDFLLSKDRAFPLLKEYSGRCVPPWSEKELWHKLESASKSEGPRGSKLHERRNNGHETNGNGYLLSPVVPTLSADPDIPCVSDRVGTNGIVTDEWIEFPTSALPDPLGQFVETAASAIGCDPSMVALPLLSCLAGAIGNSRVIKIKGKHTEPSILWTAIVSPSGTAKSPAIDAAMESLQRRETELFREFEAEIERWEAECDQIKSSVKRGQSKTLPKKPICKRLMVSDITVEALAVRLLENPRGLLLCRDELSGWLNGFDQYKSGKGGDSGHWLSMNHARVMQVDRKGGDGNRIHIPLAAVSITGGIQPAILQRALGREHLDSGLAARLLMTMPPVKVNYWTDAELTEDDTAPIDEIIGQLLSLQSRIDDKGESRPIVLPMLPSAKELWISFFNKHAEEHSRITDADLLAAWSKLKAYAARLALITHLVRVAAGDETIEDLDAIDVESISRGVSLTKWFCHEVRRVYRAMGETPQKRQERELIEIIEKKGGSITARDLSRCSRRFRESGEATKALASLVTEGLAKWDDIETGGKAVRKYTLT